MLRLTIALLALDVDALRLVPSVDKRGHALLFWCVLDAMATLTARVQKSVWHHKVGVGAHGHHRGAWRRQGHRYDEDYAAARRSTTRPALRWNGSLADIEDGMMDVAPSDEVCR